MNNTEPSFTARPGFTEHKDHGSRGHQWLFAFPTGYGASVIQGQYSYGGDRGLYELAVLKNGSLCYTTPITDDVIGHLSEDEVGVLVEKIGALSPPETTPPKARERMSDVKRYHLVDVSEDADDHPIMKMVADGFGRYVEYDDFDALQRERDGLLLLLKEARMGLLGSGDWRLLERISAAIAASKASGGGEVGDGR